MTRKQRIKHFKLFDSTITTDHDKTSGYKHFSLFMWDARVYFYMTYRNKHEAYKTLELSTKYENNFFTHKFVSRRFILSLQIDTK